MLKKTKNYLGDGYELCIFQVPALKKGGDFKKPGNKLLH